MHAPHAFDDRPAPAPGRLLDDFALSRSRSAEEARQQIGRALSPHQLQVRDHPQAFDARHNQVRLGRVALNVLSYGAEVQIDPGERGDFYLIQLPLQGRARVDSGGRSAWVGPEVLSVLLPGAPTSMLWSGDCAMLMLQVPRAALGSQLYAAGGDGAGAAAFRFTQSRHEPAVAAWWQAVADLTRNLHWHGRQWLRHPAAKTAMEAFLLGGLALLLPEVRSGTDPARATPRQLQRALDYIEEHALDPPGLAAIAQAASMSPRTLETAFRRHLDQTPLGYARSVRLDRVHAALREAATQGADASVTDIALQHGFVHMGRFATYYRARFGCPPSRTLRAI